MSQQQNQEVIQLLSRELEPLTQKLLRRGITYDQFCLAVRKAMQRIISRQRNHLEDLLHEISEQDRG